MKIPKKIKILSSVCGMSLVLTAITFHKIDQKDIVLKNLQRKILAAANNVPGFDLRISKIVQESAQKLAGDKERFKKLIMTMDNDRLNILSHLVLEYDPNELIETIEIIQKFFGPDYKPIVDLFQHRDDRGRSALYFAVLRKHHDMLEVMLNKAKEIFGQDKKEFLYFINGENRQGHRENLNYRTPFILAAYNDDQNAVRLLLQAALYVFAKDTNNFLEFLHARDANGATAAFYVRDATQHAAEEFGVILNEISE